jgi:F0F1-type ATP synthase membrane subunit b/b'
MELDLIIMRNLAIRIAQLEGERDQARGALEQTQGMLKEARDKLAEIAQAAPEAGNPSS